LVKKNIINDRHFKVGNEIIETVQEYTHLGVNFTSNGLFTGTKSHITEQAIKAISNYNYEQYFFLPV